MTSKKTLAIFTLCTLSLIAPDLAAADDVMTVSVKTFRISIPAGWLAQYTQAPAFFILYSPLEEGDTFQESINLTSETLPRTYTNAEYIEASIRAMKPLYKNFKILAQDTAHLLITGEMNGIQVQQSFFIYIQGKKAYVLTCSATPESYPRYADIFKQITATFKY